jgi:sulfite exporter TauE/SafE
MDAALAAAAALMGLAGGPHCAAMCGAACNFGARVGAVRGLRRGSSALAALHAGRVVGYSAMGAVVATGVNGLGAFSDAAPMLRPLWAIVHVAAVLLGAWLLAFGRAPAWLSAAQPRLSALGQAQPVRIFRTLPAPARAGLLGVAWVVVPCGLLQSALLVAALASNAAAGAAVMATFGLASTLGLSLAQILWSRLRDRTTGSHLAEWPVRAAGALLAGASLLALWHGLGAALCGVAP